jgi:hypothetical protein
LEGNPPKPGNPYCGPTKDQPTNRPINLLTAEELKYSRNRAWGHHCLTNNLLEVWQNLAPFDGRPIGTAVEALFWRETSQSPGTLIVDQPTTNQPTDHPTDGLTAEESKFTRNRVQRSCRPTNNLLEVWQNLPPFGGRLIGAAVEALFWRETSQSPGTLIVDQPMTDLPTEQPTN